MDGTTLRVIRTQQLHMTQAQLGRVIGYAAQYVGDLERRDGGAISRHVANAVRRLLRVKKPVTQRTQKPQPPENTATTSTACEPGIPSEVRVAMTGKMLKDIRVNRLRMTQRKLARALGYRQKIRVSEFERESNPVPIPQHIANAVLLMGERGSPDVQSGVSIRKWERRS